MALIFFDGFDTYENTSDIDLGLAGYTITAGGSVAIASASPRFAGGRYVTTGANGVVKYNMPATSDVISFGFACNNTVAGAATGTLFAQLESAAAAIIIRIGIDALGALRVGRGDFTTNLIAQSADGILSVGAWHYIEVELVRSATVGELRVWVDGVSVIALTGLNTGATILGGIAIAGAGTLPSYDDFYYCNNATGHLGDCRVETLVPNADTADKDFGRSAGADNYALVDDIPEDIDATYVTGATVGDLDLYDCTNLSSTPTTIHAVMTEMFARKDDVTVRAARVRLKSGATSSNGATKTMATSYSIQKDLYLLDPNTAAAWTAAAVNAAQIGPEIVT